MRVDEDVANGIDENVASSLQAGVDEGVASSLQEKRKSMKAWHHRYKKRENR